MSTLLPSIGAAFLGGVILNVMPCVLPVLTMKVFHMIEHGDATPAQNRANGLFYTAGVVVTFIVFAAFVIALKAGGERVGWGMQFTNPALIAGLTALMVIMGLNGLGVFEFIIPGFSRAEGDGGGSWDSFSNGIIASIMATPCSAPFLGGAAAFAFASDTHWAETLVIFIFIGLGLAFPFALISFVPALGKRLPRPGAWMETFKHIMGFTLLAAAVWLFGVLLNQITSDAANWFLAFLLLLSVGLWALERFAPPHFSVKRRLSVWVIVGLLLFAGGQSMIELTPKLAAAKEVSGDAPIIKDGKINWADFSPDRVKIAGKRSRPVFVDYTADWCANCKTQEKLVLETKELHAAFKASGILPMKADLTNENETIWEWLEVQGRSGIPAYVIYMPDGSVDLLPEVITKSRVLESLAKAAKKYPKEKYLTVAKACLKPDKVVPQEKDASEKKSP